MPRVPVLDQQAQARTAQEPAPLLSPAPTPDSFGLPQARASEQMGAAVSRLGDVVAQRAVKLQEREDDKQVLLNQTAFQQELQNRLFNTETDDNGRPQGFLSRNFSQAKGATVDFDAAYRDLREKFLGNVPSQAQKIKLAASMDAHASAARGQVISHEASQLEADFKNVLEANRQTNIDQAATITNPGALTLSLTAAQNSLADGYKHMGMDQASIDVARRDLAGKMVTASVGTALERDAAGAQRILDAHKDMIPGPVAAELQKAIDGKAIDDKKLAVWDQVKGFRLADGNADLSRIQAHVMALNVPAQQKEQILSFTRTMANAQDADLKQARAGEDRAFLNDLYTFKRGGGSLTDALKLAGRGFDPADRALKEEAIKKLYANPTETNPVAYVQLWERIQNGAATKTDLVGELSKGNISSSDFEGLWKELVRAQTEGTSPAEKDMRERVKMLAEATYGTAKDQKGLKKADEFVYTVQKLGQGRTPEEQWKLANDLLQKTDVSWSWWDKPRWQDELKREDAQNLAWGSLYQDLGRDTVNAIGREALAAGRPSWNINDVAEFAAALGGPQNIRPGTPAGNAIRSLLSHGQRVTPANVKAVLDRYKDGTY